MDIKTGKWRIFLTAVLIAAVMLASGCGTQKPVPVVESASEDMTEAAQTAETVAVPEPPKLTTENAKVGISFARSEDGDNERLLFELRKALELQGFMPENIIVREQTRSRSRQAELVEECLAEGCSLVICSAVSDARIPSLADRIAEGGASAIFVNCTPDEEELERWEKENIPAVWIGATEEQKVDCQMTILHDYSGTDRGLDFNGDGSVGAIVVCEDLDAMEKLQETVEDLGSNLKILREVDTEDPEEISLIIQNILNEYRKEAELILCSSEETARAAADGVQLRHRLVGRDILVIGTDAHEDTCTAIINKLISGSTFTDFYEQANLAAVAGKDLIDGNQQGRRIASVVFKVTEENAQEVLDQLWDMKEKVEEAERQAREDAARAATEAAARAATEAAARAATEAAAESATDKASESATETADAAITEASAGNATEAAAGSTTEKSVQSGTEASAESTTEKSAKGGTETTAESTTEKSVQSGTEASAESTTEKSSKSGTETTVEGPIEAAADSMTAAAVQSTAAAETTAESAAEGSAAGETAGESSTESSAESKTESSAASTTEPSAASTTEAPADHTAEASAASTTESSADSTTESSAAGTTEASADRTAEAPAESGNTSGKSAEDDTSDLTDIQLRQYKFLERLQQKFHDSADEKDR
ncbi:MAG: hypothetical protein IJH81_08620 [Lachnospiraceae bacterium]|nr:hypothetical protein [Lachnospiraceae bacterium]